MAKKEKEEARGSSEELLKVREKGLDRRRGKPTGELLKKKGEPALREAELLGSIEEKSSKIGRGSHGKKEGKGRKGEPQALLMVSSSASAGMSPEPRASKKQEAASSAERASSMVHHPGKRPPEGEGEEKQTTKEAMGERAKEGGKISEGERRAERGAPRAWPRPRLEPQKKEAQEKRGEPQGDQQRARPHGEKRRRSEAMRDQRPRARKLPWEEEVKGKKKEGRREPP
jgi:hypothetical protein